MIITIDFIDVLNNFHPITNEAAIYVASHLSFADRRECVEGYGQENVMDIVMSALVAPNTQYWKAPNGKSAAIGGVQEGGKIWMLCTDTVREYPRQFARDSLRMTNSRPEKFLWNVVDERNGTHLKLLRFLGFKFLRKVPFGPKQLPFIECCKIQCQTTQLHQQV